MESYIVKVGQPYGACAFCSRYQKPFFPHVLLLFSSFFTQIIANMRVLRFAAIVALLTTGVLALPRSNSKGVDVSALQIRDAGEALDVVAEAISDFESTVDVKEAQLSTTITFQTSSPTDRDR